MNPIRPRYWKHIELQRKFERRYLLIKWSRRVLFIFIIFLIWWLQ
jgi:uncharacterized membrane protein